jgi:DNA-binding IclR family transcriptional regulator
VLLAFDKQNTVEKVIENGLISHMPGSITDPNELRRQLESIRQKGYSVSAEELTAGTKSVAAPIRDHTGNVVSAITVVGPLQRMKDNKIPYISKKVIEAGKEASRRLGYDERYFKRFAKIEN